jgi:hypothetical protein
MGTAHKPKSIRARLKLSESVVIVVERALQEQNVEVDDHAAITLRRYVSDEIDRQVERLELLLGEPPRDDDDEGGAS